MTGRVTQPGRWERLADAAAFAMTIHAEQTRKGAEVPYISHLLGVAGLVLEYGGNEDQAIAGLLHDAIEDQGAEQEPVIEARFGPRAAAIVRGCTDADTLPKPPWRERKEAYIAHLEHAGPDVWLVSCADKLYNARAILVDFREVGEGVFSRFTGGKEGTLWYYRGLADCFARLMPGRLAGEQQAIAPIRQVVFSRLHQLALQRLIEEHLTDWRRGLDHKGKGSAARRAIDIRGIYELSLIHI